MTSKSAEVSIHVNVPKALIDDIDWLVRYQNENRRVEFPKPTRTDMIKNEILGLAEKCARKRAEIEDDKAQAEKAAKMSPKATTTKARRPK